MRSGRDLLVCGALVVLVLALVPARANAQRVSQQAARPIESVEGVDTFKAYCAVCHGPDAKGNGPAATALKKAPADLTLIGRRHGGTFSPADVENVIMGSSVLESHGSRDMPIWGPVFRSMASDDAFMKIRVSNLVGYLKTIQVK